MALLFLLYLFSSANSICSAQAPTLLLCVNYVQLQGSLRQRKAAFTLYDCILCCRRGALITECAMGAPTIQLRACFKAYKLSRAITCKSVCVHVPMHIQLYMQAYIYVMCYTLTSQRSRALFNTHDLTPLAKQARARLTIIYTCT